MPAAAPSTPYHEEVVPFLAGDGRALNLIHVHGDEEATRGPVVLVHGAGVRANIFRAPVRQTLVDALITDRYDVWLENWRASIDVEPSEWTLDQAAVHDHPAALRTVVRETGQDSVKAIIHCRFERWLRAHERQWRQVLQAIAWVTLASGLGLMVMPGVLLALLDAGTDPTSRHAFGIEGMFIALFGGLLLHGLKRPRENGVAVLWSGVQGRKRSLTLAGGGMRVAWQAGAVRALKDAGLTFQHGDGTSGGIINLAMLLSGLSPKELCDRWRTLRVKDFVSFVPPEQYLRAWNMEAMGDADGIVQRVFPHLGTQVDRDLLVAGISLPIFMPPVRKNGAVYTDSVWIQDANLLEAVHRGADELWVLWCIGNTPTYERGVFHQYVHMIEMSANGALFSQLEQLRDINARIRAGEEVMGHREPIAVHLIKPERPLPLDPDFYAGHITAASLIDMGYSDAWRYLAVAGDHGLPLTPEMTQMTEPAADLTFRETMSGPLALGVTDPVAGAHQGKETPFTMHCTISVEDMDAFVRDDSHAARLVAHVTYPLFGENLPVRQGSFNLFRSTDDSNTRLMSYGLRFAANGKEYYLEGTKTIHDDRGPDLWRDTTRLYCQLHQGPDARGPVVGAGVLKLGVSQLLKLIASMRSAREGTEGVKAVGLFGKLFLGTLWDLYAPRARKEAPEPTADAPEHTPDTPAAV